MTSSYQAAYGVHIQGLIYITVFTRINAAALIKIFAPQVRRLFEGGAYLKIGRHKQPNLYETSAVTKRRDF